MQDQIKSSIARMLYHLNNGDRAKADKHLNYVVSQKVKSIYSREYDKVKQTFSKENV